MTAYRLLPLAALLLGACSSNSLTNRLPSTDNLPLVYHIDIQQGNVITQDMLARLKPGMEKDKVRFIMGSPLLVDTFRDNRWDYYYSYKKGGGDTHSRLISVYFEEDRLVRLEGDVTPAKGELKPVRHRGTSVEVPGEYKEGFVEKVKSSIGLGDDDADAPVDPALQQDTADSQQADAEITQGDNDEGINESSDSVSLEQQQAEEKGLFARLLEKIGVGDNEDETDYDAGDITHRDPSNPDYRTDDPIENR